MIQRITFQDLTTVVSNQSFKNIKLIFLVVSATETRLGAFCLGYSLQCLANQQERTGQGGGYTRVGLVPGQGRAKKALDTLVRLDPFICTAGCPGPWSFKTRTAELD